MKHIKQLVDSVPQEYDHIIGISRGGLVPAVYLSHALDIPMSVMSYSSNSGNGDKSSSSFDVLVSKDSPINITDRILLVDDICDTGYTIRDTYEHLAGIYETVRVACIHYRENDVFTPDYYSVYLEKNDPWVIYPWE